MLSLRGLIAKRVTVRLLLGVRPKQDFAKFTAVNLRAFPHNRLDFRRQVVPALQMPRAKLALLVTLIASTLLRLARLDFCRGVHLRRYWSFVRQRPLLSLYLSP